MSRKPTITARVHPSQLSKESSSLFSTRKTSIHYESACAHFILSSSSGARLVSPHHLYWTSMYCLIVWFNANIMAEFCTICICIPSYLPLELVPRHPCPGNPHKLVLFNLFGATIICHALPLCVWSPFQYLWTHTILTLLKWICGSNIWPIWVFIWLHICVCVYIRSRMQNLLFFLLSHQSS